LPTFPFFCAKDCGGNACARLAPVEDGHVTRIRHNPAGGRQMGFFERSFAAS
jgi:hypothetical protein